MLAHRFFPLTAFEDLRGEVERVFDACGRGNGCRSTGRTRSYPAVNVWEDEGNTFVEAEVPGMTMENLEIEVLGRSLTIKGSRTESHGEGASFHRRERIHGTFTRQLTLDSDVDSENVKAVLKDGVLTVTMPKAASAKPRRIEVTNG